MIKELIEQDFFDMRGAEMFLVGKFNKNLRALEIATRVRTVGEMYLKHVEELGDERFDSYVKTAKSKADGVIALSDSTRESSELEDKDRARDKAVQALFAAAEMHAIVPIAESNEAIKPIKQILDAHGKGLVALNYSMESGKINSLLGDLEAANVKTAVESLFGLKECVADLKAKQAAFEAADVKYSESKSAAKGKVSATQAKKELLSYFNESVVDYLNFMLKNGEAKYEAFAKEVDTEVQEANAAVLLRTKKQQPVSPSQPVSE